MKIKETKTDVEIRNLKIINDENVLASGNCKTLYLQTDKITDKIISNHVAYWNLNIDFSEIWNSYYNKLNEGT